MFRIDLKKFRKIHSDKHTSTLEHPNGHSIRIAHSALTPEMHGQLQALPMHKMDKVAEQAMTPKMASGGEIPEQPTSSTMQDSPEQIVADANANANANASKPAPIDPKTEAIRSLYNQNVRNMSNIPGDPIEQQRITASQFGPGGEPPTNLNVDAMEKSQKDYDASQQAELAQKEQATAQMERSNNARMAGGLPPIPVQADMAAAIEQPPPEAPKAAATPTPTTPPETAMPGDKELAQTQRGNSAVAAGAGPATQPGTVDTQHALVQAKQMTYDALMREREHFIEAIKDVKPETIGKIFADKSLPGKLSMVAGLLLGGMGSGLTGQPNAALAQYHSLIDNDLKAQQTNLATRQGLLANNLALTHDIKDAIQLSKVQMMDYQMHKLVQLAQKYPNNPQIQQNLQALGMLGMQSTSNMMDTVAANVAWRHSVSELKDPLQRIQFNPVMSPEQKNGAIKEYGTYQNMDKARTNILDAFDKVAAMPGAGTFSPQQRNALLQPLLAQAVKDSEGRITPQDVPMIEALLPSPRDVGKSTRNIKRQQLAKFMSTKMHFPMLQLAGVDTNTPTVGAIETSPPKLGK